MNDPAEENKQVIKVKERMTFSYLEIIGEHILYLVNSLLKPKISILIGNLICALTTNIDSLKFFPKNWNEAPHNDTFMYFEQVAKED